MQATSWQSTYQPFHFCGSRWVKIWAQVYMYQSRSDYNLVVSFGRRDPNWCYLLSSKTHALRIWKPPRRCIHTFPCSSRDCGAMKHADEWLHSYGHTARMSPDPILRIAKCGIVGVLRKLVNYCLYLCLAWDSLLIIRPRPQAELKREGQLEARKVCRLTLTAVDACWVTEMV